MFRAAGLQNSQKKFLAHQMLCRFIMTFIVRGMHRVLWSMDKRHRPSGFGRTLPPIKSREGPVCVTKLPKVLAILIVLPMSQPITSKILNCATTVRKAQEAALAHFAHYLHQTC